MLSQKENMLCALRHKPTQYRPFYSLDCIGIGFSDEFENGPMGGGQDAFGVTWVGSESTSGAPIPQPGIFILEDITQWKNVVTIPAVDAIDWEQKAQADLAAVDREKFVLNYDVANGVFDRICALMGFENALISLACEPDACWELFTAITEYKLKLINKIAKYYEPDMITHYDDIATHRSLFMSPDTYRELIKPHHKRICDQLLNLGIIPVQHTCGKCDVLIEDFIEAGSSAWSSIQPMNDIYGMAIKYGDRFNFIGGYDTNGPPGHPEVTPQEIIKEVNRCISEYGKTEKGYIFWGFLLATGLPEDRMRIRAPLIEEMRRLREEDLSRLSI